MCLIAIAAGVSARYPFVVAANRDERHARPALAASWWGGEPRIFGGRDLAAGGTWLAVDEFGRFGAVTNFHDADYRPGENTQSRGTLVPAFLGDSMDAAAFVRQLESAPLEFGPYNLLLFDGNVLQYSSNRGTATTLGAGVHVLSNTHLDATWPKITSARTGLSLALELDEPLEALLELLAPDPSREPSPNPSSDPSHDPSSGGRSRRERYQDTLFVRDEDFGTRCSTVVLQAPDGTLTFMERRFDAQGSPSGDTHVIIRPRALPADR